MPSNHRSIYRQFHSYLLAHPKISHMKNHLRFQQNDFPNEDQQMFPFYQTQSIISTEDSGAIPSFRSFNICSNRLCQTLSL